MAADYPFRRILGVELFPALHRVAQENLSAYNSDSQQCFAVEAVCGDAREFIFPAEPIVLYLFNSLPEAALIEVMANLDRFAAPVSPRGVFALSQSRCSNTFWRNIRRSPKLEAHISIQSFEPAVGSKSPPKRSLGAVQRSRRYGCGEPSTCA